MRPSGVSPITIGVIEIDPGRRSVSPPKRCMPNAACASPSPRAKRLIQLRDGASGSASDMR